MFYASPVEKKKEAVTDISKQGGQKRKLGLFHWLFHVHVVVLTAFVLESEKAEERLKSNNRDLSLVYSDITKDLRVFIWWLFV
jgi:hypothetical protein